MAAAVSVTPAEIQEGDTVAIDCTGFLPNTQLKITIPQLGIEFDVTSDASGEATAAALAVKATATLTTTGNAVAAETVTIGGVTYTWRASVGATANEVLVGASASASLDNLKAAVNADPAGSGTLYGSATVVNPTVGAGAKTASTLQLYAKAGGTGGNAVVSTETMTNASFGGTTFAGGAAAPANAPMVFLPQTDSPFTVSCTDGTTTASATVRVATE